MVHRAAFLALGLMAFSISALAQTNYSAVPQHPGIQNSRQDMFNSLSGTVLSVDNKPLKDVHVALRDNNGSTVASAYTNAAGMFEFAQVHPGAYDLMATSGVSQAEERVDVTRMPGNIILRLPVQSTPTDGNPASSISVAQFKVPSKARDELKSAREASAKGKDDDAAKHLAKALEIYPKYADAITMRALLKMDAKDTQGAIADLQEAIKDDENCAMAYMVMGAALNQEAKFDDAIRTLQRGEALSPTAWQIYFEMGKSLIGKGQYEPALRQLDRAQSLVPKEYAPLHMAKAHAMMGLNNYTDAMTELQAYLDKTPKGPQSDQAQKLLNQAKAFATKQPGQ